MNHFIGGLNAKVGADNTNFEHIMGRHGLETMNENGEDLPNCAQKTT